MIHCCLRNVEMQEAGCCWDLVRDQHFVCSCFVKTSFWLFCKIHHCCDQCCCYCYLTVCLVLCCCCCYSKDYIWSEDHMGWEQKIDSRQEKEEEEEEVVAWVDLHKPAGQGGSISDQGGLDMELEEPPVVES